MGNGGEQDGEDTPAARPTPARSTPAAPLRLRWAHRPSAVPETAREWVSTSDAPGEVGGERRDRYNATTREALRKTEQVRAVSTRERHAHHDTRTTRGRPPSTARVTARNRSHYRAIDRPGAEEGEWWRVGNGGEQDRADTPAARPTAARSTSAAPPRLRCPHRSTAAPEIARGGVSVSDRRARWAASDEIVDTPLHTKRYANESE